MATAISSSLYMARLRLDVLLYMNIPPAPKVKRGNIAIDMPTFRCTTGQSETGVRSSRSAVRVENNRIVRQLHCEAQAAIARFLTISYQPQS